MPDPTNGEILRQIGAIEARLEGYDRRLERIAQQTDEAIEANAAAIGENTRAVRAMQASIATLQKPIWKRPTVLGGAFAVFALAAGWVWSSYSADSPFPMFVHRNVLLTEPAIAQTLRLAAADEDYKSVAYDAIGDVVAEQVTRDGETRATIVGVALRHGQRTYNEAKTFFPTKLNSIGLGCLLALDQGYVAAIGADPARMRALCGRSAQEQVVVSLPYIDTSPLRIPFAASAGDKVRLTLDVLATSQSDPEDVRRNPSDAVDVFFDAERAPRDKTLSASGERAFVELEIAGEERLHFFTVALSSAGLMLVGLAETVSDDTGGEVIQDKLYTVTVSVALTVEPKS